MKKHGMNEKNRWIVHKGNEQGFTLVELIVTFALLAIFMTAVIMCLPKMTDIYMHLQAINHQKTICNTVSNRMQEQLQATLGVEGVSDPLGVNHEVGNGNGYLVLLDEKGQHVMISTTGAVSTGTAIKPDTDLSGDAIEFVYKDGIIAQLGADGFDGYLMRKNQLRKSYTGSEAITGGALVTRYYQMKDGVYNDKLSQITYHTGDYSVASGSGISISDGDQANVAYAIEYPYAKPFYEGYDLKVRFTIKKDAFYTYGDGTQESPSRTYVNYINYTLALYKDGERCYSQNYVVNVQNAVKYLGEEVAVKPDQPSKPGRSQLDAYVVEDSVRENIPPWPSNAPEWGEYYLYFHIPAFDDTSQDCDEWTWTIPYCEVTNAWIMDITPNNYRDFYDVTVEDNHTIRFKIKEKGYLNNDIIFGMKFQSHGVLTPEQMKDLADMKYITKVYDYEYASSSNTTVEKNMITGNGSYQAEIAYKISAGNEKRVREYVEMEFDTDITGVSGYDPNRVTIEVDGRKLRIYGRLIEKNQSYTKNLWVTLKNPDPNDSSVKPSAPTIRIGK